MKVIFRASKQFDLIFTPQEIPKALPSLCLYSDESDFQDIKVIKQIAGTLRICRFYSYYFY